MMSEGHAMKMKERENMRASFLEANEDAIKLRRILDNARGIDGFIEVPRALLDKVTVEHSFMAGWCLSALPPEWECEGDEP